VLREIVGHNKIHKCARGWDVEEPKPRRATGQRSHKRVNDGNQLEEGVMS